MKKLNSFSLRLVAALFATALLFAGCSNPSSSGSPAENKETPAQTPSTSSSSTNTGITLTAAQSTSTYNAVEITWRSPVDHHKYAVYYNTEDNSSTATKASGYKYASDEYDSSFRRTGFYKGKTDIPLSTNGTYYFWIKPVTQSNVEGEFSSGVSCSFTYSSLNAPTNVTAIQSTTSYNEVTITWKDAKHATRYNIYYNTTNNSSTATRCSGYGYVSEEYDSTYTNIIGYKGSKDVPLSQNGTYYFWIKGVDGTDHESSFSSDVSCTFTSETINAPTNVTVVRSTSDSSKITVSWKDTKHATRYNIYYNTSDNSSTATQYSGNGYVSAEYDSTYTNITGYKGSKDLSITGTGTYYFWVKAVDGSDNESALSSSVSFTL